MYWSLESHEYYAHGDCGLLAFAIHDLAGWPVVYSPDWPCKVHGCAKKHPGGPHLLCRHPCGMLVDIDGMHTDEGVTIYEYSDDIRVHNSALGMAITLGAWRADKVSFYDLSQTEITHDALNVIASSMHAGITGEAQ